MKRTLSLILVIALLIMQTCNLQLSAVSYITSVSSASGSNYTSNSKLASLLNTIFNGDIDVYSSSAFTSEVSMPVGSSMSTSTTYWVKSKTTGNNLSGKQCYVYANAVYNRLFNEWVGGGSSFSHSQKVISGGGNTVSYSQFNSAGVKCGAYMRTTSNSSGAYNGNSGHSLIILSYDSSYISYLEGNADGKGLVRITKQTWSEFNTGELSGRSRYVCHVVQPTAAKYEELYPQEIHQHNWVFQYYRSAHPHYNFYRCSSCGAEYNDTNSSNFSSACDTCTKPGSSTISTDSLSVYTNEKVKFTWTPTSNTTSYCLKYRDASYSYITVATTTATTYEFAFTEAGNYCVYVDSLNDKGQYTQSNLLYITVIAGVHNHSWQQIEYQELHPHYSQYQCSICQQIYTDTSITNYNGYCDICRQPGKPSFIDLSSSYITNEIINFKWAETKSTTHYNFWLYIKNMEGEWVQYEHSRYVTSDFIRDLPVGEYSCKLQSYNKNHWREDGTDWLYTESDMYYFSVHAHNYEKINNAKCSVCNAVIFDYNNDETVNILDFILLEKELANNTTVVKKHNDDDGIIEVLDLVKIKKCLLWIY